MLGNKCDINDKRQVSKDRGEKVRSLAEVRRIHNVVVGFYSVMLKNIGVLL